MTGAAIDLPSVDRVIELIALAVLAVGFVKALVVWMLPGGPEPLALFVELLAIPWWVDVVVFLAGLGSVGAIIAALLIWREAYS